ncbi:MAG: hypothetical protein IKU30_02130 [Clostridia bacterium]|nr:hypothetical protein [Clostridia bacterium]
MYAPHTVTLYNVINETDPATFVDTEHTYITLLEGVFLDATKATNVRMSGLESADAVDLFIPFDVKATSLDTGAIKHFVEPMVFWAASEEDRATMWTLGIEGTGGESFFVKGELTDFAFFSPADYDGVLTEDGYMFAAIGATNYRSADVARMHDNAYNITKVDTKDFGSVNMRHWQVGAV